MPEVELDIDPDLDTHEQREPNPEPEGNKQAKNLTTFFGGLGSASSSIPSQCVNPKKRASRQSKSVTTDAKQTRLGAGLRPIKTQQVAATNESVVTSVQDALSNPGAIRSVKNSKAGKRSKDYEGVEDMTRNIKGQQTVSKAASDKTSKRKSKPKKGVEANSGFESVDGTTIGMRSLSFHETVRTKLKHHIAD
jgi:hypothetical protein